MKSEDDFEWDESKAKKNFKDHQVRFQEAIPVFDDLYSLTVTDDESDPGEQRLVTMGMGALGRIPVVVYTYRSSNYRLISARKAEPHEIEQYINTKERQ